MLVCVFMVHSPQPRVCPFWTLWALSSSLQGQDRNFLSSSRDKSQTSTLMQESNFPTSNFPYLTPLPSVPSPHPCVGDSRRLQREDLSQGGQLCICVSKVRLPRRMLSLSGRWLWGERDDSTSPRGWCVKRYGKARINRGPGILPCWMWLKLPLDPMGEIKDWALPLVL